MNYGVGAKPIRLKEGSKMREQKSKVIVGFDAMGKPKYAKQSVDKEARAADELTRRIKKAQQIINKENEEENE